MRLTQNRRLQVGEGRRPRPLFTPVPERGLILKYAFWALFLTQPHALLNE
jgi:hypothetical protein